MDWNLRACGRRGHVTYAPTEVVLRDRLRSDTPVGEAWRCLRCGTFVVGAPVGSGPADHAPTVMRGRALRDATILRLLALERYGKGLAVLVSAYWIFRFRSSQDAVQRAFQEDLPLLRPFADKIGWNLDNSAVVHTLQSVIQARSGTLLWVAVALMVYGALQLAEGTGLWLLKRWGEYFAVIATSLFIPVEVYELAERVTWLRIAALIVNVAAVVYIAWSKRLFGVRGGHAAYQAERQEASLLEVEKAAVEPLLRGHHRHGAPAAVEPRATARNG